MTGRDTTVADDLVYHGFRRPTGGCVIAVETLDGEQLGLLRHVPKHSPTGYSWGYGGSGPADCARSLLLAAVGDEQARCPECGGTRRVVYDLAAIAEVPYRDEVHADCDPELVSDCFGCVDGYRSLPYQAFKREFVASWDAEWSMRRSEILAWLHAHHELS